MVRAEKTGRGQLLNLHRDKEEASRGRRCEGEERIYARLSVPVVRPRVANYRYITDFEYNDRTFIVCTLWRCFCGNKVSKPKSHQKTNCQKNMHLLKNSDLLRCRILGRFWLTKDLIEVIIYIVHFSPCIWIFLHLFNFSSVPKMANHGLIYRLHS